MTPMSVLLVDDEHAVLESCARLLHRSPYRVETSSSAIAALALARERAFDVVVADERMPDTSGTELLARVRAASPETVCVLMTGGGTLATAVRALNSGVVFRYLEKPFARDDLLTCLNDAAQAKRHLRAVARDDSNHRELREMESAFDRAIVRMWTAVQPIVRAADRSLFAYEVLARSADPGVVSGGDFISLAQRAGRVLELDRAVRAEAARLVAELPAGTSLFVNLSSEALSDPWLGTALDPLTRVAGRVVLEVTEGVSPEQVAWSTPRVAELRRCGFRIAVDDLGAGYAGLGSVARLRPDFVKLDREMVESVHTDPVRATIVRGLVDLCRDLGVRVVAEGIETPAEYEELAACGCDLFQGYLFARPGPAFPEVRWPDRSAA